MMMTWFEKRRIGDLPSAAAARHGGRPALIFKGQRWTWAQFAQEVDRIAKGLIAIGVQPGDHVSIWLTNCPECLFLLYAIPRVGAVAIPLNTRYRTDDIAYVLNQSDTSFLIAAEKSGPIDYREMLEQIGSRLPLLKKCVMLGQDVPRHCLRWDELLAAGREISDRQLLERAAAVDPDSLTLIIYTSGTTSAPKGAMHTHILIRLVAERAVLLGLTHQDVHLSYLPFFHAYGYAENAITTALTGGCQVLTDTFRADEVLDLAEEHQATITHGFDTHYGDLIRAQLARPRRLSLRLGSFCAGQISTTPIARRAQEVLCPTVSGWGMSEAWSFPCMSHPLHTLEQRCEASGYPMLDVEIRIADPATGASLPAGAEGEIWVKTYSRMQGYYKDPVLTAQTIDADGWLHSGDMGRLRPDGHLVFLGRYKDVIKVGGENVSPAEVEAKLLELDCIQEAAVVGLADDRLLEVAIAYVVLLPGSEANPSEILAHLSGKVASFKIPRHVFILEALPKTPSGKVRKVDLRARAANDVLERSLVKA
ncbi:MAG TPA: AMP-binding protein [Ramlibacter sp.]|nr:AMP-binding protein [Ramlibacter sp.]